MQSLSNESWQFLRQATLFWWGPAILCAWFMARNILTKTPEDREFDERHRGEYGSDAFGIVMWSIVSLVFWPAAAFVVLLGWPPDESGTNEGCLMFGLGMGLLLIVGVAKFCALCIG